MIHLLHDECDWRLVPLKFEELRPDPWISLLYRAASSCDSPGCTKPIEELWKPEKINQDLRITPICHLKFHLTCFLMNL